MMLRSIALLPILVLVILVISGWFLLSNFSNPSNLLQRSSANSASYFIDDFNRTNPIQNEWNITSGPASVFAITQSLAKKSNILSVTSPQGLSAMSRNITGIQNQSVIVSMDFYDSGTASSEGTIASVRSKELFIIFEIEAGKKNYGVRLQNDKYESIVPRTEGWHTVSFIVTEFGTYIKVDNHPLSYIDQKTTIYRQITSIDTVSLGHVHRGVNGSNAAFDNVRIEPIFKLPEDRQVAIDSWTDRVYALYGNVDLQPVFNQLINWDPTNATDINRDYTSRPLVQQAIMHLYQYQKNKNPYDLERANEILTIVIETYPKWKTGWTSPVTMNELSFAMWWNWVNIDLEKRQQFRTILANEADFWTIELEAANNGNEEALRAITPDPTSMEYLFDTKAESNGWTAQLLGYAHNMLPDHPNSTKWDNAAKCYAFHTLSKGEKLDNPLCNTIVSRTISGDVNTQTLNVPITYFSDNFEGKYNFYDNPIWRVHYGDPGSISISDAIHSKSSQNSLMVTNNNQGLQGINHQFTEPIKEGVVSIDYYDTGDDSGTGAIFSVANKDLSHFVIFHVDDNFYRYRLDNTHLDSTVARTKGWHTFQFFVSKSGTYAMIDGKSLESVGKLAELTQIDNISLGHAQNNQGVSYYDNIQVTDSPIPDNDSGLLGNHNLWPNPVYTLAAITSLQQGAFTYLLAGNQPPKEFSHNLNQTINSDVWRRNVKGCYDQYYDITCNRGADWGDISLSIASLMLQYWGLVERNNEALKNADDITNYTYLTTKDLIKHSKVEPQVLVGETELKHWWKNLEQHAQSSSKYWIFNSYIDKGVRSKYFPQFAGVDCSQLFTKTKVWGGAELSSECSQEDAIVSNSSLHLAAADFSDSEVYSKLISVQPNTKYTVSYWVKTKDLQPSDAKVLGRIIFAEYDKDAQETDDVASDSRITRGFSLGPNIWESTPWTKIEYEFVTKPNTMFVRLRAPMGLDGHAKGNVWFDGIELKLTDQNGSSGDQLNPGSYSLFPDVFPNLLFKKISGIVEDLVN